VTASFPAVLVVSGTGTDVGKTVVTAAVAALAASSGLRVAVVKPVQTGEPPGPSGDLATVRRLSGVTETYELARFADPLSPEAAARAAGLPPLDLAGAAVFVKQLDADLILIEGAGGPPAGGALIETQLDHRIAMAFLVLGLAAKEPVRIDDAASIATSFPGFIAMMNRLGAAIGEAG